MLYVARHGQTVWNVQNKVCGITDVELTEIGKEQAKVLAYEVQENSIDLIISSPLKRAVGTSSIISKICNIPFEVDERLIECRIINTYFRDMTNDEFFNYTLQNGKLQTYKW